MMMRQSCIFFLLLATAVFWSTSGLADEYASGETAISNVFTLGQMVVTAKSTPVKETTIDVVSNQEMRTFNRDNVADALNLIPGITLSKSGARNEQMVFVRGFDIKHAPCSWMAFPSMFSTMIFQTLEQFMPPWPVKAGCNPERPLFLSHGLWIAQPGPG